MKALAYARAGWAVFPVEGKSPLVQDWPTRATSDVATVEAWWTKWPDAAIGAIPGSMNLCAIDYDTKSGKSLEELRQELEAEFGELADSAMIARTPSGGEHHYYRVTGPVASSNSKFVRGVDIRSANNGYIILPPSEGYKWVAKGKAPLMGVDVETRLGAIESSHKCQAWSIEPDLPENIELAEKWMLSEDCRESIEGEGGNQALFDTACMLVSYGISEEKSCELLDEVYNLHKCEPPWEMDDIRRVASNAHRYHSSPPGNLTSAYRRVAMGFQPINSSGPSISTGEHYSAELNSGPFRITDRDAIIDLPPPKWLIQPYLMEDTCAILTGGYSTFKSFIALDMALSIVSGLGSTVWQSRLKGPVVYMLGEGRAGMGKRLSAWEEHHGVILDSNDILFVDPVPHIGMSSETIDALVAQLREIGDGYKFVVLDTIGRAVAGQNENASETASALSSLSDALRQTLGACVLAIGHTRKDRTTGQGATRGSGVFENDADTVLNSEKLNDNEVTLEVVKQKDASEADPTHLFLKSVGDSLVVTRPEPGTASRGVSNLAGGVLRVIDAVATQILSGSPHEYWSTRNLATHVSLDDRISLGPETVRKRL